MNWLKNFRYKQNFTISEMAIEMGVSKSLYEKVEYGDRNPSVNFMKKFKDRFPDEDINNFFKNK